jgi:SAM-dependent methyltransferase
MTGDLAAFWDAQAEHFDDQPDHGLVDDATRTAWAGLLASLVPASYRRVADLGCGTGSLAVLMAQAGHHVTAMDMSSAMVQRAERKAAAAGVRLDLLVGDVSTPGLSGSSYDAVLSRHVLWSLPDPASALAAWVGLLVPGGRLLLVDGVWSTGSGLPADELSQLLASDSRLRDIAIHPLDDPALWGGPITDERYAVTADIWVDPLTDSLHDESPDPLPDRDVRD